MESNESYMVRVIEKKKLTHDVIQLRIEKPPGYAFTPGQATEVAINRSNWVEQKRPFTFTSLPADSYLEFIIKMYPSHNGVTAEMNTLTVNDELLIGDAWGAIAYQGMGLFIAGGAGVTPFISILRQLNQENAIAGNKLIFANKSKRDIFLQDELSQLLGDAYWNILSDEIVPHHGHGFVSEEMILELLTGTDENIYVCGPPPMMDSVLATLDQIGISKKSITVEL